MHSRVAPLFVFVAMLGAAVATRADQVDDFVKGEMQKRRIPGLSIAVVRDGKIVNAKGYGRANLELDIPATPDTVYKIGSVSKQFIAAGIMLLVQEGKLQLTDPINHFLEAAPGVWKDLTIRHMLTHTSGLEREAPGFSPFKIQSDAEVIKTAYGAPLRFKPGGKWEYCNLGYFILAEVISKVSGKPWGEFLQARVFRPLGMSATRTTSASEIVPNRADGYAWRGEKIQNADDLLALRPSGAFLSTVVDLAKWDAALYTDAILKGPTREQMWESAAQTDRKAPDGTNYHYGFGWQIGRLNGHREVFHGGTLGGFRAAFVRFIDDRLTVAVLTNCANASPEVIARRVAALYIPGLTASEGSR